MTFIKHQSSYHVETSQLICFANQLTGFYMMGQRSLIQGQRSFEMHF